MNRVAFGFLALSLGIAVACAPSAQTEAAPGVSAPKGSGGGSPSTVNRSLPPNGPASVTDLGGGFVFVGQSSDETVGEVVFSPATNTGGVAGGTVEAYVGEGVMRGTYRAPNSGAAQTSAAMTLRPVDRSVDGRVVPGGARFDVTLNLMKGVANCPPSRGFRGTWSGRMTVGRTTYEGCAYVDWSTQLVSLIPAIDACMAATGSRERITYAGRAENGWIVVRQQRPVNDEAGPITPDQDERSECIIEDQARPTVASVRIVKGPWATGENWPTFTRAPAENPGGECYEAERVTGAGGVFLGWLDTPEGC
jgi:hypothetical protein